MSTISLLVLTLFLSLHPSSSFSGALKAARYRSSLGATKIVWFRDHALRIHDNEAISAAVADSSTSLTKTSIVPVYLWTTVGDESVDKKTGGTAKDVFVANALQSLNAALKGALVIGSVKIKEQENKDINTNMINELIEVCRKSNAKEVYYLKSHHENKDDLVAQELTQNRIVPRAFGGSFSLINYSEHDVPWKDIILEDPWRSPLIPFVDYVKSQMKKSEAGGSIISDVSSKAPEGLLQQLYDEEIDDADSFNPIVSNPLQVHELVKSVGITQGGTKWGASVCASWPASEESAQQALDTFLECLETKDDEGVKRTHLASRLSPYLARGMISPRQVYNGISAIGNDADTDSFVRRICWRDYTYAVAALYPDVTNGKAIRDGYESLDTGISLEGGDEEKMHRLNQWKKGQCGFPLIDAGMRQLVCEGWMPQKVRLACSTFLVEGLGVSWREGMQHFAEFLVDYDNAINSNMWMNAGCVGLDPYYVGMNYKRRMYWDNEGTYVRKWCPELANLPDSVEIDLGKTTNIVDCLYEPWASPIEELEEAGVYLGKTYPKRICNDRKTRSQFFTDVRVLRAQWPSSRTDDKKRDLVDMGSAGQIGLFTPRAVQVRQQPKGRDLK
jgi:deoxyribodipyrimidine photo-lyase